MDEFRSKINEEAIKIADGVLSSCESQWKERFSNGIDINGLCEIASYYGIMCALEALKSKNKEIENLNVKIIKLEDDVADYMHIIRSFSDGE